MFSLTAKGIEHPFWFRANTSDVRVLYQVLLREDYRPITDLRNVGLVLDCGANVGYASIYLLNRFPGCKVIAIEPDPDTFEVLARNLRPYGPRAVAQHTAIWSHETGLKLDASYADGEAWARQTRETQPGEKPDLTAVSVQSLFGEDEQRASIVKMDIEGAEAVVFAETPAWLSRTDLLVIELHGEAAGFGDCHSIFNRAIAGQGFTVEQHGENTVCRRGKPTSRLVTSATG